MDDEEANDDLNFNCEYCKFTTKYEFSLRRHINIVHINGKKRKATVEDPRDNEKRLKSLTDEL